MQVIPYISGTTNLISAFFVDASELNTHSKSNHQFSEALIMWKRN